jgi:hypothetical protein
MRLKRTLLLAGIVACLAGCAADPPPDEQRHRCVEIPNGLVECNLLSEGVAAD